MDPTGNLVADTILPHRRVNRPGSAALVGSAQSMTPAVGQMVLADGGGTFQNLMYLNFFGGWRGGSDHSHVSVCQAPGFVEGRLSVDQATTACVSSS